MSFRFQKSVCLFAVCLAVGIACQGRQASGENPPSQLSPQADWEAQIEAVLDAKGEWDFKDVPLNQVCDSIQQKLGIDVVLDTGSLDDLGIDSGTPITLSLNGISNRSILRLMLRGLELTYMVEAGALRITTAEFAEWELTTKVYPVGDLLVHDRSNGEDALDYDFLRQSIMSAISTSAWDEVGGPGAIKGIYESLVVSQNSSVHEQVAEFISAYRRIVAVDRAVGAEALPSRILGQQEMNATILQALDQPLTVEFKNESLKDVVARLSDHMDIPILVDTYALEDLGIDASMPVSGKFSETPLRFVLFRMLSEVELTYIIRDEVLQVTTHEAGEQELEIGLYPVRDLVQLAAAQPPDAVQANCDFDSLIRVINSTIAPDTWDEVGGPAVAVPLLPAPTLLIAQTLAVHEEISQLLAKLRAAKKLEAARTVPNEAADPTALVVRSYPLRAALNSTDDIAKLVMRISKPGTWDDAAGTFVQGLGAALVVKHNASSHREVQKLLSELGVWSPIRGHGKGSRGGGRIDAPVGGVQPVGAGGGF